MIWKGWFLVVCMLLLKYISWQKYHRIPIFPTAWVQPSRGQLTHPKNCSRYCENNRRKTELEEPHKLWKCHAAYLKDFYQRKGNPTGHNHNNTTKFKIGQPVIVKYHAHHTFEPKYLLDYNGIKMYSMPPHSCS